MRCTQTTSEEQSYWKERLKVYTFCTAIVNVYQTDETASAQELSKCLRRIFTVNLRSDFSEMDVLYPLT